MNRAVNQAAADGPKARWEADIAAGFERDSAQEKAVDALDTVYRELLRYRTGWLHGLRRRYLGPARDLSPVQGLYMWGGVGRGKTHLMDIFHDSLPFEEKRRLHFHRFMRQAHDGLKRHGDRQYPLEAIADDIARDTRVLCFDEFFVSDVADAMILGGLLKALFRRGISLVATSNIPPDKLYLNGLQRQRFMPAIEAIKQHTRVLNVDGGTDYRLRVLEKAEIFHSPLDRQAEELIRSAFRGLAPDGEEGGLDIEILGRHIPARGEGDGVAWFDFDALCDGPRSQNDYIDLAHEYHTVLLSDVPVMGTTQENAARRFIALVDEFYDRNVKMIISAAAPLDELYQGRKLRFEFERTHSRLLEMQTRDYLALPHQP
ncbi:cell division protein ZapE [Natronospira bacteriovora]|uniref:Cell division protein ZapE n=1 Tax=Natronospira bacteriovora TaxID=3069753 RepID=A0ABU0W8P8_9GAMM|nr:cell division protein ZapE [Natronospira sp. AB-CW4]MDQ2070399.1 cell division protein ZapE [Natronospira sp. AB-CW4]